MGRLTRRDCLALSGGLAAWLAAPSPGLLANAGAKLQGWQFGRIRVTKIVDVVWAFDAARAYPGAPLSEFDRNAAWLPSWCYDPAGQAIILSFHSYLVQTRHLNMIVDTCWGEETPLRQPQVQSQWLQNLATAGVAPEDVDVVTCTHFHADHVGWNTRRRDGRWEPTFPRAQHLFSGQELRALESVVDHDEARATLYRRSILPVIESGRAILLEGTHEVADGVRLVASAGHSPGHQHVELVSQGKHAILSGDIFHNPIEVRHPEWTKVFDEDHVAAHKQRLDMLDRLTDVDIALLAAHFAGPTAGHVLASTDGRFFKPLAQG